MKIVKARGILCVALTCCLALSAFADGPKITDVVVRQRWPWSRLVDIDYVLTCGSSASADVTLTAKNGATNLSLPAASLSGDSLNSLTSGSYHMVWDPLKAGYTNAMFTQFSVELTATPVPLYMIVDLTLSINDADHITYVYEEDLTNGLWGAWVRNPVTNAGTAVQSVIWSGVTTNDLYKTDKLVLRRIPAKSIPELDQEMYVGVFEVTQGQWNNLMGSAISAYFTNATDRALRPMEFARYNAIRGAAPTYDWPSTGSKVDPNSFIGKLRDKTAIQGFDLPTYVQWEYACRAGTTTLFNDGETGAYLSGGVINNNGNTNQFLAALGRYRFNGGFLEDGVTVPDRSTSTDHGTAVVGSYRPNAWGLYDMHGNVFEFCLEWNKINKDRKKRGGNWYSLANNCRSEAYSAENPNSQVQRNGFRLFCVLASTCAADRVENPYANVSWDKIEYLHSLSHQHGHNPQIFWDMGYKHLPLSNYYPSKPLYPLPEAFALKHPEAIGGPNAEQHGMTDSGIHFNAIGSLYTTGYGFTPRRKAGTAPVEHVFDGLIVFDPQSAPWRGIYRLDVEFASLDGKETQAEISLTVEGAMRAEWKTFATREDGLMQDLPLTVKSAKSFCLKANSDSVRVKIDFDPAKTKITKFRLMQGTNRPWRDTFNSALDGTLKDAQGNPIEGLLYPDGGGITINHPWTTLDELITMLDFDERVLGIEVWNHRNLFGGVTQSQAHQMPFYEHWDNILRTGRRCFGFFVKDHFLFGRGRNVLLVPRDARLMPQEREHDALCAYRDGHFFGLIGAMSVDASGKVVSPYDYSTFQFTRISVRQDKSGTPLGLEVGVGGNDFEKRPNTQIRFVTDQGIALVESGDKAFFAFPRAADGSILCRYVRVEAFAYPNTHLNGKPLTRAAFSAMNVLQIARLHDRLGDVSPTRIDPEGEAPVGIVDMIFAQPILIRR